MGCYKLECFSEEFEHSEIFNEEMSFEDKVDEYEKQLLEFTRDIL